MKAEQLLRRMVLEEFGLKEAASLSLVEAIKEDRELGALSDDELAHEIAARPALRRDLASRLSVGESFFSRHAEQSGFILDRAAERLAAGQPLVVWAAGCSRGEEVYTVALQLLCRFGSSCRSLVSLLGTDIHGPSLACARAGRYGNWSLRAISADVVRRHFRRDDDGYQLLGEVVGWPEFHHLSIQEHLTHFAAGSVDIVLFRNVGIYLTEEALTSIHAGFGRVLRPGGLLLQAITDPRPLQSPFTPIQDGTTGAYELASQPRASAPAEQDSCCLARRPERRRRVGVRPAPSPRPASVGSQPAPSRAARAGSVSDVVASASGLADLGRNDEALLALDRVLRQDPTARGAYFLRSQILLQLERPDEAAADLRSALLLDPADRLARYWYVIALQSAGQHDAAFRQRRTIAQQLASCPPGQLLADGVTTAAELQALVAELEPSP